jgi:hypothetical protein
MEEGVAIGPSRIACWLSVDSAQRSGRSKQTWSTYLNAPKSSRIFDTGEKELVGAPNARIRAHFAGAFSDDYQGRISPLACQKLPVFSRVIPSIRSMSPAAAILGSTLPCRDVISVRTKPG